MIFNPRKFCADNISFLPLSGFEEMMLLLKTALCRVFGREDDADIFELKAMASRVCRHQGAQIAWIPIDDGMIRIGEDQNMITIPFEDLQTWVDAFARFEEEEFANLTDEQI